MRRFIRSAPMQLKGRNTQPAYNPEANDQKLRNWTSRLNNLASSGASKMYLAQLGALVNYYNRGAVDSTQEIDWNDWRSRIITEGLVDKVKENYEDCNKEQYNLDGIFTDVFSRDSKAIDDINNQMAFHTAVWMDNYMDYVAFLNDLGSVSSPLDYNPVEWIDMHPGYEARADSLSETHSYFPGARHDINLWAYMVKQFAWGKKITTFYRHPTEDFKAVKATKNSMGR